MPALNIGRSAWTHAVVAAWRSPHDPRAQTKRLERRAEALMSWKASAHVLELATKYPHLTLTQMAVLYALAARHNHEYHCSFGTLKRVATDAHVHPVTVSSTITELEDMGLLCVFEGQLPRKKSDPDDHRLTRGTMWCFVGLDPEEGPDIEGATPRVRTSGRPPAESISSRLNDFPRSADDELAGSDGSISPGLGDELAGLNSPFKAGSFPATEPESLALQAKDEPDKKPAARAHAEAPPQCAQDLQPDVGVPPQWQELRPGIFHGLPDGSGTVVLLKARCPRCEQAFPVGDLESGEIPEHPCEVAYRPIDSRPRSPGNLGGYFRRRRPREAIPTEVQAELAALAEARTRAGPSEVDAAVLAEHERLLALARGSTRPPGGGSAS